MNETPSTIQRIIPHQRHLKSYPTGASAPNSAPNSEVCDSLTRIFNTAIISTQADGNRNYSAELFELTQSAPFKAILSAVRHLSKVQGIAESEAAEQVIQTFRKVDEIWNEYLFCEGLNNLKKSGR